MPMAKHGEAEHNRISFTNITSQAQYVGQDAADPVPYTLPFHGADIGAPSVLLPEIRLRLSVANAVAVLLINVTQT